MTKVAVITGGTSGIGERSVERLLADGWEVWSLGRSGKKLEEQAGKFDAGALSFRRLRRRQPVKR